MEARPFKRLKKRRAIRRPDLPNDLAEFYTEHEGLGQENDADSSIRLCSLDEVSPVKWQDLTIGRDAEPSWRKFAGLRIGVSAFFDDIVYVLTAPSCSLGMIAAFGENIAGPGGTGPKSLEPSLVLAAIFADWLRRLESSGWVEYGLTPGDLAELPKSKLVHHMNHYKALNPGINWDTA